jgi:hypothetical protein
MTVTTGLDETRIKCDSCPNTIDDDEEGAIFIHDWDRCRESDTWMCPCCKAKEHARIEREYGHYRQAVRDFNEARRDGDFERARAIAFTHGVIAEVE